MVMPNVRNRVADLLEAESETGLLTPNAIRVLENRYLKKDDQGRIVETPRQMFERVARHVAGAEKDPEKWFEPFFDAMWSLKFIPNSPTPPSGTTSSILEECDLRH